MYRRYYDEFFCIYALAALKFFQESLETREALINEVAEKHDMGRSLRAEVATLTEQCRRADMLIQLKEDIIKGMRKELKQRPSTKARQLPDLVLSLSLSLH